MSVDHGRTFASAEDANPLGCRLTALTTVSADFESSVRFYRDVLEMALAFDGVVDGSDCGLPGIGETPRRCAVFDPATGCDGAAVRVLSIDAGAAPNRPRPRSGPHDPGFLAMEGRTQDAALSFHRLASAGIQTISPPRYYFFRNAVGRTSIDVMSYAAFGPGGEQLFLTSRALERTRDWPYPNLHAGFHNVAMTSLDQRPVDDFYSKALGLRRTSQLECYQDNANELIGAPEGTYFLWGNVGHGVSIEVWEVAAAEGRRYPTSLARTGLAMATLEVDDLAACRALCESNRIEVIESGALPIPDRRRPDGFCLRGAVGELLEIVQA